MHLSLLAVLLAVAGTNAAPYSIPPLSGTSLASNYTGAVPSETCDPSPYSQPPSYSTSLPAYAVPEYSSTPTGEYLAPYPSASSTRVEEPCPTPTPGSPGIQYFDSYGSVSGQPSASLNGSSYTDTGASSTGPTAPLYAGSSGTLGSDSGAASYASAPAAILYPAVHWNNNGSDYEHLTPSDECSVYYSENGVAESSQESQYAQITFNSTKSMIILEHSDYVTVSPAAQGLLVKFSTLAAYQHAQSAWNGVSELVLVTYAPDCNPENERSFWHVDSLAFDEASQSCTCKAEELGLADTAGGVDVTWGTYTPGSSGSGSSGPSSSGSGSSGPGSPGSGSSGPSSSGSGSSGSGSGFSNSTTGTSSSDGSCSATSSFVDGLRAASCGDSFDETLDSEIGYLNFADDYNSSLADATDDIARREIVRRGLVSFIVVSVLRFRRAGFLTRMSGC